MFDKARAEATFLVNIGELNNIDIVRAIQSPSTSGTRGGKTKFDTLSGTLSYGDGRYVYKQVQLASGPLNANANFTISSDSALSGRVSASLGSRGLVVARGTLSILGEVRSPLMRP